MSDAYVIPDYYSNQPYAFFFGALDRFADFFSPLSKMQGCNKLIQYLEGKLVRMHANYPGAFASRTGDEFAFLIEQGEFAADAIRLTHEITRTCMYAAVYDVWTDNILKIYGQKSAYDLIYFLLKSDQHVYSDMVSVFWEGWKDHIIQAISDGLWAVVHDYGNFWIYFQLLSIISD